VTVPNELDTESTALEVASIAGQLATPAVVQEVPQPQRIITPSVELLTDDGVPAVVVDALPPGWSHHPVDLQRLAHELLERPRRHSGTLEVENTDSFIDAVKARQLGDDPIELHASERGLRIRAVLNPPHGDTTGHADYGVVCAVERTPEWDAWRSGSGKLVPQAVFAEFIEDHLNEITDPPAAELLELAQTFSAQRSLRFKRATTLASGSTSLIFDEDEQASAGKTGQLEIPERFTIAVRVFRGGELISTTARLRYRIGSGDHAGELFLGWRLDQPDDVERTLFGELVESVGEALETVVLRVPSI
jgi:uncharacterized protein YfdQ (DUF2303 family)